MSVWNEKKIVTYLHLHASQLWLSFRRSLNFKLKNILLFVAGVLSLLIHDQGFGKTMNDITAMHSYEDSIFLKYDSYGISFDSWLQ